MFTWRNVLLAVVLLTIARPAAIFLTTLGSRWNPSQRRLAAWFGIRGVGSVYYLAYASTHGASAAAADDLAAPVLVAVALSVVLHGASATPLMRLYKAAGRRGAAP